MKFTFKTEKESGRYASFYPDTHLIKFKRKIVGQIEQYKTDSIWHIRLMINKNEKYKDNNPNCSWMWITLHKTSYSLDEAKIYLNLNVDNIITSYSLHFLD